MQWLPQSRGGFGVHESRVGISVLKSFGALGLTRVMSISDRAANPGSTAAARVE
jgi:hypothetical protein